VLSNDSSMNEHGSPSTPATVGTPALTGLSATEIDRSCRAPLLVLFVSAALWLLVGSVFALIASIHFHSPGFLADIAWLSYGRLQPAGTECLLYGFCIQSALGIGLWLFARLGRARLAQSLLAATGALFWNLGTALGLGGILAGDRTGFVCLDMPGYAAPLLLAGYLLIALSSALTFHHRTERSLFVSQWFLLAALFWFPWIYSTAQLFLVTWPVRGVAQAMIGWWFANNLQTVYLGLAGLAFVFYFLPKLTGNDLHSRYLALLTFWMLLLFSSWGGISQSAPTPAWMPTLSTAATVLNLVPLLAVGLSAYQTTRPGSSPRAPSLPLRFVLFGVVAFLVAGLMQVLGVLPRVCEITDLTWFGAARCQLHLFGFFAMTALGAIYYIVPRLLEIESPSSGLVRAHFWLAACGITLVVVPEALAGIAEGLKLQDPNHEFVEVMRGTLHFLRVSTLGLLFIAGGQALFLGNLAAQTFRFSRSRAATTYAEVTADLFKIVEVKP